MSQYFCFLFLLKFRRDLLSWGNQVLKAQVELTQLPFDEVLKSVKLCTATRRVNRRTQVIKNEHDLEHDQDESCVLYGQGGHRHLYITP